MVRCPPLSETCPPITRMIHPVLLAKKTKQISLSRCAPETSRVKGLKQGSFHSLLLASEGVAFVKIVVDSEAPNSGIEKLVRSVGESNLCALHVRTFAQNSSPRNEATDESASIMAGHTLPCRMQAERSTIHIARAIDMPAAFHYASAIFMLREGSPGGNLRLSASNRGTPCQTDLRRIPPCKSKTSAPARVSKH
jgi:hypothetical protein